MSGTRPSRFTMAVATSAAVLLTVMAMRSEPLAQRGGGGGSQLVPATASSLLRRPDAFIGKSVSMMATVEANLTATAFTVDQNKDQATGEEVLVLVPTLQEAVELNTYVTVQGRVIRFVPAEVAKLVSDYTIDLAPDVIERYRGGIAVVAAVVINDEMIDVAKVPPPPLTPEEEAFDAVMKQVSAANGQLRPGMQANNAGQVMSSLDALKTAFEEAEAFFTARGEADDAVGWAQEAQQYVESVRAAVAAGDWDAATTANGNLSRMCSSCHGAYRMQIDDGSYRVRPKGGQ